MRDLKGFGPRSSFSLKTSEHCYLRLSLYQVCSATSASDEKQKRKGRSLRTLFALNSSLPLIYLHMLTAQTQTCQIRLEGHCAAKRGPSAEESRRRRAAENTATRISFVNPTTESTEREREGEIKTLGRE